MLAQIFSRLVERHVPEIEILHSDTIALPDKQERKRWSAPRVIESEIESTEAGLSNAPEASGGLLTS
jgi:hypothetical protein